ncbi:MAG: histidine kinase [Bacteroidales bacterium]|nr:histidine kinase [Bacteroidales bacterium]
MKIYTRIIKLSEPILVIFVWMVLIITPILFRDDFNNSVWRSVRNQVEILVPLSLLFILNRFIFVPKFLFRGRWILYVGTVLVTITLLTVGSFLYDTTIKKVPPRESAAREYEEQRPPPPGHSQEFVESMKDPRRPLTRQPRPMPPFANFLIMSVMIVGFDTGLRSGLRLIESENEKVRLEKENVANQLVLLRNQVSPHFFMNTLNNIHSLIDINSEEAKEAIIKLSKMMRYLLYETETEKTTIKKEVEFLES